MVTYDPAVPILRLRAGRVDELYGFKDTLLGPLA
jgi:hypothetical protein